MGKVDTIGMFLLSCNHTVSFRTPWPKKGDHVCCRRCGGDRQITGRLKEYRVKCSQCDYVRTFGMDRDGAMKRAAFHARDRAHDVHVCQGEIKIITIYAQRETFTYL